MTQPIQNILCPQQLGGRQNRNDSTSAVGVRYDVVCVTMATNKATTKFLFLRKGGATEEEAHRPAPSPRMKSQTIFRAHRRSMRSEGM
ncbi:hypothetical protein AVEN_195673-1 [Araneus ventricosus]|uniref:Uncharacterized protein n=1 Tax=Araneus ventricosus TaxID=182803 RepID=A0A4Y2BC58_ARAVE|nr:hypothetical protein AVEN_195673-1 [Araneus ventricosus]